jgi:hypothetical protein
MYRDDRHLLTWETVDESAFIQMRATDYLTDENMELVDSA